MILIQALVLSCFLKATTILVSTLIMPVTKEAREKYENVCLELVTEPSFKEELIVDKIWTSYYTWNENTQKECLILSFEEINDAVKKRYQNLMQRYLKTKVEWSKATLQVTINASVEFQDDIMRMLLVPVLTDKGSNVGLFQSIPKIHQNKRLTPYLELSSKVSMALKLFKDGRYLIMADCVSGVITLLVRKDQKHTWKEIDDIVDSFKFDAPGYPSCKYSLRKRIDNKL